MMINVTKSPYAKVRVGRDNDGGYVVAKIPGDNVYDCFLSAGVSDDVSFEDGLLGLHPEIEACHLYDGSVDGLPEGQVPANGRRMVFHKQFITPESGFDVPEGARDMFLKMDIEGAEYSALDCLRRAGHFGRIKQMVVEFHGVSEHLADISEIEATHALVHVHANNAVLPTALLRDGTAVCPLLECTYLRRDLVPDPTAMDLGPIPDPFIDQANVRGVPEACLRWPDGSFDSFEELTPEGELACIESGKPLDALRAWGSRLRGAPASEESLLRVGTALCDLGYVGHAMACYRAAMSASARARNREALGGLCRCHSLLASWSVACGCARLALENAREAVCCVYDREGPWVLLATVALASGQSEGFVPFFVQCVQNNPRWSRLGLAVVGMLAELGRTVEAAGVFGAVEWHCEEIRADALRILDESRSAPAK
jgi:hypothetical protein